MKKKKENVMIEVKKHSPADKQRIEAVDRNLERRPPKFKGGSQGEKQFNIKIPEGYDLDLFVAELYETFGLTDTDAQTALLKQLKLFHEYDEGGLKEINNGLAIIHAINPKNALEGLLAVQMVGTHNIAMEMMRRAVVTGQDTEIIDRSINRASKFLRIFTAQTEAMQRLKGKSPQKVVVEHVTVNAGGQAIVGQVAHKAGGRGNNGE